MRKYFNKKKSHKILYLINTVYTKVKKIKNYSKVSKSTEQYIKIYGRKVFFSSPGNPSLTHQEVVLDIVSGPPIKKIRSLTVAIINTADNENLAAKLKITQ